MTLPNFLIIGAAKSGTTALYRYLSDHPKIFMSSRKELHYFSHPETSRLVKGPDSYQRVSVASLTEYKEYFKEVKDEKAIGEASPSYLYFPECAKRIKQLIPDVKLIAILRNPIDRAFSAYMHAIRDGWEPVNNFTKALLEEEKRINQDWEIVWHYTKAGLYYEQLLHYFRLFDGSQIQIFLYEDLQNDPEKLIKNMYKFLNVDDANVPDFSTHPNVSGKVRSRFLFNFTNKLFLNPNPIKNTARKLLPESVRWRFTTSIRNLNIRKDPFPEGIRPSLIDFFQNDIDNLQKLINRDLSSWIK